MRENVLKTFGRFSTLILWELEKTFTFLMLAIITGAVFANSLPAYGGGVKSPSKMPTLTSIKGDFADGLVNGLSMNVVSSFVYVVIIFAALTSSSLSKDISMGYTRVLLSYPIERTKLFLSKILVLLFVPFSFFACSYLFGAALTYPSLFWHMPFLAVAYVLAAMLIQTFFIFAVSFSASLYIRHPVMSFLASVVALIGTQQVSNYLPEPYKYLLPTQGTHALFGYYFYPGAFESQYVPVVVFPLIGMIVVPAVILVMNLVYFRWRFQT